MRKRNCIVDCIQDYTVIDLETTGLSPEWDSIIEVSALRVRNGVIVDRFVELINPEVEISDFIESLTGITNAMVADARLAAQVIPEYLDFIGSDMIIGHNVRFDLSFLDACAESLDLSFNIPSFIDTLRMSRRLYPDLEHHRLKDMVKHFNINSTISHRAECDTEYTQTLYALLCAELDKRPDKKRLMANKMSLLPSRELVEADGSEFDTDAPYFGRVFAFTGVLERMTRRDAMQIVVNHGGLCEDHVNKRTNYLVLGNLDYINSIKNGKSNKQRKAENMILKGCDIEILSENVFYDMFDIAP